MQWRLATSALLCVAAIHPVRVVLYLERSRQALEIDHLGHSVRLYLPQDPSTYHLFSDRHLKARIQYLLGLPLTEEVIVAKRKAAHVIRVRNRKLGIIMCYGNKVAGITHVPIISAMPIERLRVMKHEVLKILYNGYSDDEAAEHLLVDQFIEAMYAESVRHLQNEPNFFVTLLRDLPKPFLVEAMREVAIDPVTMQSALRSDMIRGTVLSDDRLFLELLHHAIDGFGEAGISRNPLYGIAFCLFTVLKSASNSTVLRRLNQGLECIYLGMPPYMVAIAPYLLRSMNICKSGLDIPELRNLISITAAYLQRTMPDLPISNKDSWCRHRMQTRLSRLASMLSNALERNSFGEVMRVTNMIQSAIPPYFLSRDAGIQLFVIAMACSRMSHVDYDLVTKLIHNTSVVATELRDHLIPSPFEYYDMLRNDLRSIISIIIPVAWSGLSSDALE